MRAPATGWSRCGAGERGAELGGEAGFVVGGVLGQAARIAGPDRSTATLVTVAIGLSMAAGTDRSRDRGRPGVRMMVPGTVDLTKRI